MTLNRKDFNRVFKQICNFFHSIILLDDYAYKERTEEKSNKLSLKIKL